MAEYNFDALTPEDKANIKKELETARQLRGRFHTTPTLPKFSGTDAVRGEVDFETWKYMLTSLVEEQGYSEATLKTAIRKSLVGEAAQHLRNHGAADVAGITRALELHYGEVMCETTTWQDFYSAKQRRLESATSWWIRLEEILCRIEGQEDGSRSSKLRTQWWTQLYSKALKTATRHKYDDTDVELDDLFIYVKKIEQEEHKDGRYTVATLYGHGEGTGAGAGVDAGAVDSEKLEDFMKRMDKRMEAMMSAIEKIAVSRNTDDGEMRTGTRAKYRCYNCNKEGHLARDCRLKSGGMVCYNCNELGHMAKQCQKPKGDATGGQMKSCWSTKHQRDRRPRSRKPQDKPQAEMKQKTQEIVAREDDVKRRILGPQNHEDVVIEDVKTVALIDSGATVSTISRSFYQKHCSHRKTSQIEDVFRTDLNLTGFSGEHVPCTEYVALQTILPGLKDPMEVMVCIVGDHCHTNDVPALIGTNVMDKWKAALRKRYEDDGTVPPVNRMIDDWTVAGPMIRSVRMSTLKAESKAAEQSKLPDAQRQQPMDWREWARKRTIGFPKHADDISDDAKLKDRSRRRHKLCEEQKQALKQKHEEQTSQMVKRNARYQKIYDESVKRTQSKLNIGNQVVVKKMRTGGRTRMRDIPTFNSQIQDESGEEVERKLSVWCGAAQTIEADGLVVVSTKKTSRTPRDGGTYKVVHDVQWSPSYGRLRDRVRVAFREIQRRHARNVALEVDGTLSKKQRAMMTGILVEAVEDMNKMKRLVLCVSTRKEQGLLIKLLLDYLRADTDVDDSGSESDDGDEDHNYEYGVVLPETEDESAGSDDETSGDSSTEDEDDDVDKVDEDDVNRQDMQRPQRRHTREREPPQWYVDVMTH